VPARIELTFAEDASQRYAEYGALIDRQLAGDSQPHFAAWLGKLRGLTARIAGILHLSESAADGPLETVLTLGTTEHAIEISEYLRAHARIGYECAVQSALDENPRRILRWLRDGARQSFSHRDAVLSFSGRLTGNEVSDCLQRLVEAGYLREQGAARGRIGRNRKPSYSVSPWVFKLD
jgi:hypothetical protein